MCVCVCVWRRTTFNTDRNNAASWYAIQNTARSNGSGASSMWGGFRYSGRVSFTNTFNRAMVWVYAPGSCATRCSGVRSYLTTPPFGMTRRFAGTRSTLCRMNCGPRSSAMTSINAAGSLGNAGAAAACVSNLGFAGAGLPEALHRRTSRSYMAMRSSLRRRMASASRAATRRASLRRSTCRRSRPRSSSVLRRSEATAWAWWSPAVATCSDSSAWTMASTVNTSTGLGVSSV